MFSHSLSTPITSRRSSWSPPGTATILGNVLRGSSVGIAFFGSELSAEFKDGVLAANTKGLTTSPAQFNGLRNSVLVDNQDQPASDAEYQTREPDLTPAGNTYVKLPCLLGDLNGDGAITLADAVLLINWILNKAAPPAAGTAPFKAADVNKNGILEAGDVVKIIRHIVGLEPLPRNCGG